MWDVIKQTFQEWNKDKAPQLAAALAYYTIFSIPPLLILALAVVGYFYNADAARQQLLAQLGGLIDAKTAEFVQSLLENTRRTDNGLLASLVGFFALLAGASGIFIQLQEALNTIWDIPKKEGLGLRRVLGSRLRSFLMALASGVLLLVFLLLSGLVSWLSARLFPGANSLFWPQALNFLVLFVTITLLFAMLYRVIPERDITWGDVWLGAAVTAGLFLIGRIAIGFYLSVSQSGSAFGAGGSLIVLLVWIYYSAQIFLLGAEFTQVYARKYGSCR